MPSPVHREVKAKLQKLVDTLAWSMDDGEDVSIVLSIVADISLSLLEGSRLEVVDMARSRAAILRRSEALEDLIAASELEDLVCDLLPDDDAHPP